MPQFIRITLLRLKKRITHSELIEWLTGLNEEKIKVLIAEKVTFKDFLFKPNSNAELIKGVICGYRIEEIETLLTKQVRYLDKVLDELAKGKKMKKIKRQFA